MTVQEQIQTKIDSLKAEIASLEAHLAAGGTWLGQEVDAVEAWFKGVLEAIKGKPSA